MGSCVTPTPRATPTGEAPTPTATPLVIPVLTPERLRPTPTQETLVFPTPTPTRTPTPSPTATPAGVTLAPDGRPTIEVTQPQAGQRVRAPLVVTGTAVVYEAAVAAAVVDATGRRIAEGYTTALAGAPERGAFQLTLTFTPPPAEMSATLQVYSHSPRDGSIINLVSVPVVLLPQ